MISEVFGNICAGLGIYFVAYYQFCKKIQNAVSHKLKTAILKFTRTFTSSALVGGGIGFFLQDPNIVTGIIGAFSTMGVLKLRKIIYIIAASNIGAIIFLYFIFYDVKLVIIWMLGFTGILFYFSKRLSYQRFFEILFYLFLIQFGFLTINNQSSSVITIPEVIHLTNLLNQTNSMIVFFLSAFMVVLFQSSIPWLLIAINLYSTHVITFNLVMIMIYGIFLGNAIRSYIFSLNLEGVNKQIFIFQVIFGFVASFLFLFVYYLEKMMGTNYIGSVFSASAKNANIVVINLILFVQSTVAVITMITSNKISESLALWFPKSKDAFLEGMTYLNPQMIYDAETLVQGLYKEIDELIKAILLMLELRLEQKSFSDTEMKIQTLHQNFENLSDMITAFLNSFVREKTHITGVSGFFDSYEDFNYIVNIEEHIFLLCNLAPPENCNKIVLEFQNKILESSHLILSVLQDYLKTYDPEILEALKKISNTDKSIFNEVQERIERNSYQLTREENSFIFSCLRFFQYINWSINKFKTPSIDIQEIHV